VSGAVRSRFNLTISGRFPHSRRVAKPALGRGLGALLGGMKTAPDAVPSPSTGSPVPADAARVDLRERVERVPLGRVQPCALQPRKDFGETSLQELADSIREQGIVQPLIVRSKGENFEIIAGERRWRAAQLLGLREVPVIVRQADDRSVLELALIENLQRENLNPIEEAQGYARLIDEFNLRQEDAAAKVGKSRVTVANALRLLKLDPDVQSHVRDNRLSVGHAKVLLGLESTEQQKLAAERVLKLSLSVRQTEELVSNLQKPGGSGSARTPGAVVVRDAHVTALENRLRERFGTRVQLRYRQGKGAIEVRFFSDDELDRILAIVGVKMD
jgi:ParB family chromosome partitioning protein